MKKKVLFGTLAAAITGLFLSSCTSDYNKPSMENGNNQSEKFHVTGDAYLLQSDGSIVPISVSMLRASENEKGRISGLGSFAPQTQITVKAERKGTYRLYKFYTDQGGVISDGSEALVNTTGTSGNITKVKDVSSAVTFKVVSDVHFKAIFSQVSESGETYSDLSVGGHKSNFSDTYRAQGETKTYTLSGNKNTPIIASGRTVGTDTNSYTDWDVTDNQSWITAVNSPKGTLKVTADPYKSKTGGPRSGVVTVSKGSQSIKLTVNQDSYYDDDPSNGTDYPVFNGSSSNSNNGGNDGSSNSVTVKSTVSYTVRPSGESNVAASSIYSVLGQTLHVSTPIYKNGSIIGYKNPSDVTFEYANPSSSWVTYSNGRYSFSRNVTGSTRTATQVITLKAKGKVVRTITITFSQATDQFHVGGDID